MSWGVISFALLGLNIFLGRLDVDRCGAQQAIDTLINLIWLGVQHHDVVSNVFISGAKTRQISWVLILANLRV